jgi:Spondin_N
MLIQEMDQQGEAVLDHQESAQPKWFVNERDFVHIPPIEASFLYPYMSMMASFKPSPDWYTGFYNWWLIDEYSRTWYDHLKWQVKPWDAGTDSGETYEALESDLDPPIPIQRFVPSTAPPGGELRGPDGESIPNVGEIECFLRVGEAAIIAMPECDWFANPCCNETDTVNCNVTLPNGARPNMTEEYRQVLENSPNAPSGAKHTFSFALVASLTFLMQWVLA